MNKHNAWLRVRRDRPCLICERPDWCLLAADGSAAICARTKSARRCGEAGWLHRLHHNSLQGAPRIALSIPLSAARRRPDLERMGAEARDAVDQERLKALAYSLGLSVHALTTLGIGWSTLHLAWSFPMTDATGNVVGIRLRRPNGFKFAVTGSREGLFLATADATDPRLVICEGPTDTAALVCLGFRRIAGRPSCNGGLRLVIQLCQRHRPTEVVIVADADEPGQRGADNLASALLAYVPTVRVITPPAGIKDARAWLQAGGTRDDVERAIEAAAERRLSMRVVPPRGGRHYER